MCKNLIEKGNLSNDLIIWNRTTQRATDFSSIGHCTVVESIKNGTSRADIIFYSLGDDSAVMSIVKEILSTDVKGKILVDCSTIHPNTTKEESKMIEEAGADFVACPVFGAPVMAESGQLVCALAGKKEAVEKVKPHCKAISRDIIDCSGEPQSNATLLKIIGNTFITSMTCNLAEGHVLAEKTGLGSETLHQFIKTMFPGPYTAYSERIMNGDYHKRGEPQFAVDLARKDVRHAIDLANENGMILNGMQLADDWLRAVKDIAGSKGDIVGMYGAKRVESGLRYEN